MEYDLHRKKKLTSVLKASIYKVHDRIDFASVTRDLLRSSEVHKHSPLHEDILFGYPFKLQPVTTIWKVRVPTLAELKSERILERQRLENIDFQSKLAQQAESALKSGAFLARRPLPPSFFRMVCTGSLWH